MRLSRTRRLLAATAATSALLMTAACGSDSDAEESTAQATVSATGSADAPSADAAGGSYADGTYEAQGAYTNPGGLSTVTVELTLQDDVVTEVEVTPEATGTSLQFQEKFVSGIAAEVTGKRIDDLSVDKVSGSSLTSGGFNDALDKIKADAAS